MKWNECNKFQAKLSYRNCNSFYKKYVGKERKVQTISIWEERKEEIIIKIPNQPMVSRKEHLGVIGWAETLTKGNK